MWAILAVLLVTAVVLTPWFLIPSAVQAFLMWAAG
jgi:hypothetical protein